MILLSPIEETTGIEGLKQDGETEEVQERKNRKRNKRSKEVKRKRKEERARKAKKKAAKEVSRWEGVTARTHESGVGRAWENA